MYPIFTSHFSIGKSILTLDHPSKQVEGGPDSIFSIALENNLDKIFLVEESMTGFFDAVNLSKELGIQLVFGYRFFCSNNLGDDKSKHKLILFAKNDAGCKQLNSFYSLINTSLNGSICNERLSKELSERPDLQLVVPFYDSFIFWNKMTLSSCIPDLKRFNPIFFVEDNSLPFDRLIESSVRDYVKSNYVGAKIEKVKSILYKNKSDCAALQTYKILSGRRFGKKSDLSSPNLEHFGSDEFCWESYLEKTKHDK
jgi:hypothetical protein